jgi:endonuclease YncB( thermonuclease family)
MKKLLLLCCCCGLACQQPLIVKRIITSDTLELSNGDKIRYACLKCPEKDHPLYQEAVLANRYLLQDKKVKLEMESPLPGDKDDTQRVYVYTPVKVGKENKYLFVNAELVLFGIAQVVTPSGQVKRKDLLESLQQVEDRLKKTQGTKALPGPAKRK